ncbi:MAG TPA: cyanophycinase [Chloroflexia bacterium]|nr:cyanophycinase [Chloroflexia bacterium]
MTGLIVLAGGGEFEKGYETADRFALEQAGGPEAPVVIVPTAGGADGGIPMASRNGVNWFRQLGGRNVEALPLATRQDANKSEIVQQLEKARLVYMAGGSPAYLLEALKGSAAWEAMQEALNSGAIVGGSSAGAMVLAQYMYNPSTGEVIPALGLLPNTLFIPHFNTFGRKWVDKIQAALPDVLIIGVDEKVAIIGRGNDWQVYGRGWITLYRKGKPAKYQGGQPFKFDYQGN